MFNRKYIDSFRGPFSIGIFSLPECIKSCLLVVSSHLAKYAQVKLDRFLRVGGKFKRLWNQHLGCILETSEVHFLTRYPLFVSNLILPEISSLVKV